MAYTSRYAIRFADVDHARILYFPNFLHYFHCAFEDFFEHACNFHYQRVLNEHRIGFPSVHVEVDFRAPLRFGDHVDITVSVIRIGEKSVQFGYRGHRVETGQLVVEGKITTACMSMDTYKAIQLPALYRDWFEQHMGFEAAAHGPQTVTAPETHGTKPAKKQAAKVADAPKPAASAKPAASKSSAKPSPRRPAK
jgi:4-hydroxybenzoyl-CoA thioesterase